MSDEQETGQLRPWEDPAPPPLNPVTQALAMIERAARDPNVDIAKMQALQEMQFRLIDRHKVDGWHEAVASLPPMRVKKNGLIDLGESKRTGERHKPVPFAKWEDMDTVLRPLLDRAGLFLTFDSTPRPGEGGGLIITGTLRHQAGHSMSASIPLPMDSGPGRNNLQAYGSTLSYGKRYTAEMLLNIVREGEDDDGVRGGMKLISDDQAAELRTMCKDAGRVEGTFLQRLFAGKVHSFDEIEQGTGYLAARSTLQAMLQQQAKKGATDGA